MKLNTFTAWIILISIVSFHNTLSAAPNPENEYETKYNYYKDKLPDSAIYFLDKSIEFSIKNNDSLKLASLMADKAEFYLMQNDFIEGDIHLRKARKIAQSLNDSSTLIKCYHIYGTRYALRGKYDSALWNYEY